MNSVGPAKRKLDRATVGDMLGIGPGGAKRLRKVSTDKPSNEPI